MVGSVEMFTIFLHQHPIRVFRSSNLNILYTPKHEEYKISIGVLQHKACYRYDGLYVIQKAINNYNEEVTEMTSGKNTEITFELKCFPIGTDHTKKNSFNTNNLIHSFIH